MNSEECRRMPWLIYKTHLGISLVACMKNTTFSFNIVPGFGKMKLAR
jgi:hypothetical protein